MYTRSGKKEKKEGEEEELTPTEPEVTDISDDEEEEDLGKEAQKPEGQELPEAAVEEKEEEPEGQELPEAAVEKKEDDDQIPVEETGAALGGNIDQMETLAMEFDAMQVDSQWRLGENWCNPPAESEEPEEPEKPELWKLGEAANEEADMPHVEDLVSEDEGKGTFKEIGNGHTSTYMWYSAIMTSKKMYATDMMRAYQVTFFHPPYFMSYLQDRKPLTEEPRHDKAVEDKAAQISKGEEEKTDPTDILEVWTFRDGSDQHWQIKMLKI